MGNSFGKIIQNGVEYDVTPYAHKITITPRASETYASALGRLYNELKTKVSDLSTIKRAELHFTTNDGYHEIDRYTNNTRSANKDKLSFIGAIFSNINAIRFIAIKLEQAGCVCTEISNGSGYDYSSDTVMIGTNAITLYYS